jgi:hypothetical protein
MAADPFAAVRNLARELLEVEDPDWREALSWPVAIEDGGTYWKLSFYPPEPMFGGPPTFHIEKGTLRLLRVLRQQ